MVGLQFVQQLAFILEDFARAGGGGSSGGGGGSFSGGSSSSSNSSGDGSGGGHIPFVTGLISYFPMHAVGALLRRSKAKGTHWLGAQVTGWLIAFAVAIGLFFLFLS